MTKVTKIRTVIRFAAIVLAAAAASVHATEQRSEPLNLQLVRPEMPVLFDTVSTKSIILLAQDNSAGVNQGEASGGDMAADAGTPVTEKCLAFAGDPDADLGDVLKAGCKPTLGQMSALMDNPLGNVAMLFNQYDSYLLRNDANGQEEIQGNFMGILQFPKGINEDWNLINRIIYNVASTPIDQDKVDDLGGGRRSNALLDVEFPLLQDSRDVLRFLLSSRKLH